MRKFFAVLLCALILGETWLLYSANRRYENLAAEKSAVERRADVLKTLWDQTEQELTTEREKWQAEKQALLETQKEIEPEERREGRGMRTDSVGWLQAVYTQFFAKASGVREKRNAAFQERQSAAEVISSPAPEVSVITSPRPLPEVPRGISSKQAEWK